MTQEPDLVAHPHAVTWRMLPEGQPAVIQDIRDALLIRENGLFLLTAPDGSIPLNNLSGFGLYHGDMRYLSGWQLTLIGVDPIVLLSTAELGFAQEQVMTNPELISGVGETLPSGSLEMRRQRVLDTNLLESVRLTNYGTTPLHLTLQYAFDADFEDIFELRGIARRHRGKSLKPRVHARGVTYSYVGLDDRSRRTQIRFSEVPHVLESNQAVFHLSIDPGQSSEMTARIAVDAPAGPAAGSARRSVAAVGQRHDQWKEANTQVVTGHELFNAALDRAVSDLRVLWTDHGPDMSYVSAGVPWYDTLFGRDSALTAMMSLAYRPEIARSVLRCLARFQGKEVNLRREEEPGKIVHETRTSETATTGEVAFGRYYGSVDSTPLFLLAAAEYFRWTGDLDLIGEIRSSIDAGLDWIQEFGDSDGDGFVEYQKKNPNGLDNQGWKDSWDGIIDQDGELLKPPITLVEVQGYVYAAKMEIAGVFDALGESSRADQLRREASALRRQINDRFWLDEGYYALALDAEKKPAQVPTSNGGHLLWSGVATKERARRQIDRMMRNDMFSGWGVRTLSNTARRFNPIGYHLGTVWPHDNALVIAGLKRYGAEAEADTVATSLCEAAFAFPYFRLPELFSGAPRSAHQAPVPYPVACRPQAFAAAALPYILTSILGLVPDAPNRRLHIVRPKLPQWLEFVRLSQLKVGGGTLDLTFRRQRRRTMVEVNNRTGGIEVVRTERWPHR